MKGSVSIIIILCLAGICSRGTVAQEQDHPADTLIYKSNVVRWNIVPFILWSNRNINLGYERIYQPHKSFSINAGYFELPSLTSGILDSIDIRKSNDHGGFTVSADHRWYFKGRNPGRAPDGLYWGVYASYHRFQVVNEIAIMDSPVIEGNLLLEAEADIVGAGIELGYQFIIKNRLSVDLLLIGPSMSWYLTSLHLSGSVDADKESEYLQAIYDILSSTIPGFQELVGEGMVVTEGINTSVGPGFRYLIQIGYHF